ncbi:hypothetical protein E2C01_047371 [Portunus trituberculatus]|uniref:Uncharacterized protein n=1 Tax=Portunus trituberculatus TaxID=210409 RepID=A0A5B7G7E5_PORTR|nr:hypothetical protein [Portunus trituberculatus]
MRLFSPNRHSNQLLGSWVLNYSGFVIFSHHPLRMHSIKLCRFRTADKFSMSKAFKQCGVLIEADKQTADLTEGEVGEKGERGSLFHAYTGAAYGQITLNI